MPAWDCCGLGHFTGWWGISACSLVGLGRVELPTSPLSVGCNRLAIVCDGVRLSSIHAPFVRFLDFTDCCQLRLFLIEVCTKMCTNFPFSFCSPSSFRVSLTREARRRSKTCRHRHSCQEARFSPAHARVSGARPEMGQADVHLVTIRMGGPIQIVSSPRGSPRTSQSRGPPGLSRRTHGFEYNLHELVRRMPESSR